MVTAYYCLIGLKEESKVWELRGKLQSSLGFLVSRVGLNCSVVNRCCQRLDKRFINEAKSSVIHTNVRMNQSDKCIKILF